MAANSRIEWCDHTFNPWRGCTKVSAGCANCYAETMSKRNPRVLGIWGDSGTRVIASDAMWREPLRWNAAAERDGVRRRVFCASLADVCEDRSELFEPRQRLTNLIRATPWLDWLVLTKRPENAALLFDRRVSWPHNIWFGTSCENRAALLARLPHLWRVPARVRFLSCEPLLESLGDIAYELLHFAGGGNLIHWVIVGGESGPKARPFNLGWARTILDSCHRAGAACFIKQLGSNAVADAGGFPLVLRDPKGGDPDEWPDDLCVREFPK